MNKIFFTILFLLTGSGTLLEHAYALNVFEKESQLHLQYKGKDYIIQQYQEGWDVFRFYSLQYRSSENIPDGLMLITNRDGKVVKELTNTEYAPKIITYDINEDNCQDLILFWQQGAHSQTAEVWINKSNRDFVKIFEQFNDKNIRFLIKEGVPTLAFKKEYPMSVSHDNFPDRDWTYLRWDGKTFNNEDHLLPQ